jgi:hypothetical protein
MNRLFSWVKNINFKQVILVACASILLVTTTACGADSVSATNNPGNTPESRDVTDSPSGGINNYKDTDPRRNLTEAQTKAKALVDQNKKGYDANLDEVDDAVERTTSKLKNKAQKNVDRAGNRLDEYTDNIKENTEDAADYVKETGKETTGNFSKSVKNEYQKVKNTAKDAVEGTKDALD